MKNRGKGYGEEKDDTVRKCEQERYKKGKKSKKRKRGYEEEWKDVRLGWTG